MRKIVTILVAVLALSFSVSATEYTKAKDDSLTEYAKEQLAEAREVFIKHHKNQNTLYHILDNVKKPVTNEQKKAYNIIMMKYEYIYKMYYMELNEAVVGIEEALPECVLDVIDIDDIDNIDEASKADLVNEYIAVVKTFAELIESTTDEYEKELDKLDKLVKVYERM